LKGLLGGSSPCRVTAPHTGRLKSRASPLALLPIESEISDTQSRGLPRRLSGLDGPGPLRAAWGEAGRSICQPCREPPPHGAGELATTKGVSRATSAVVSCRATVTGHCTSGSNYTRGQSEAGLHLLNRSVMRLKFKMLTVKQDWFVTTDLKDAYFHISILPQHRRGEAYQYRVLPLDVTLSPHTFTKCVDAALAPLRLQGIRILNYIDDWLILAQSEEMAVQTWPRLRLAPGHGLPPPSSPVLAGPSLILGPDFPPRRLSLGDSRQEGSPLTGRGFHPAPLPRAVEAVGVAPEGAQLIASGLSTEVVETIHQSRAPSTRKLYALKWRLFTSWCGHRLQNPVNCPVGTVLEFLQNRLSSGLTHSTLKIYVVAIAAYHAPLGGLSVGKNSLVMCFLCGVLRLRSSVRPCVPTWDLAVVLEALCRPHFEPIEEISDQYLTIKTVLLLALSSLKRVGDLQALSVAPSFLDFGKSLSVPS
ncbi:hypothetical protein M9458_051756, partial [Cirrhinus mrigala]